MKRLEEGMIANDIITDLKEKTHDFVAASSILHVALIILDARHHLEDGWFPEIPKTSETTSPEGTTP